MKANQDATPTDWTDPDDAPELTDEFFELADKYVGDKLIPKVRSDMTGAELGEKLLAAALEMQAGQGRIVYSPAARPESR